MLSFCRVAGRDFKFCVAERAVRNRTRLSRERVWGPLCNTLACAGQASSSPWLCYCVACFLCTMPYVTWVLMFLLFFVLGRHINSHTEGLACLNSSA